MVASRERLLAALSQLVPRTREIVLKTPIAADLERLEFLLTLTPQNQSVVARRLDMEWTWDDAVKLLPETSSRGAVELVDAPDERGAHPVESTAIANMPEAAETEVVVREDAEQFANLEPRPGSSDRATQVVQVRLSELRPNPINEKIFSESLTEVRLRDLADHLARYGQREPIIADSSLMILSGERRWRALRLIGATYASVVVDPIRRSREELEDLVLDDFSLKRKPSLEEQLKVCEAYVRSFARRYGRAIGRPRKADKSLSGSWDSNRVHDEAAAAAGLGSRETARQAQWVVKHGDAETRAAMLSRGMSIHAAYALLHEPGDDEAQIKDSKPPPQLPSGSSEHSSPMLREPSDIDGGLPRATAPTGAVAPRSGEPPSSESAASATAGGSGSPPACDHEARNAGADAVPPTKAAGAGPQRHTPPSEGAPGLNGPPPEQKPAARPKPNRATGRDHAPDRRSFERGLKAAVGYVAALREADEAEEALRARNDAVARFDAAAFGQGAAELQPPGADCDEDEAAGEDSVLDEGEEGTEGDLVLDEAKEDVAVRPEEDEDPSARPEPAEHADRGQEDAESGEADPAAAADDGPAKAKGEEIDYSDYFDDDDDGDDADQDSDRQDDADDDHLADSEDERHDNEQYEDEESDDENELKDPLDAEVDRLVGRLRARRH